MIARRSALKGLGGLIATFPLIRSHAAATSAGPRWFTLGTSGGPQVQSERAQISNALVVGDALYLFDLGNDVQRQLARAGLAEQNLRAAFLSHHHLDRNADLGPVMITHWMFGRGTLPVIGPVGTTELVTGIAAANGPTVQASFPTLGPSKPPVRETVKATDVPPPPSPTEIYRDDKITAHAVAVDHYQVPPSVPLVDMPQALAFRVETGKRSFVYSGDTGPSQGLVRLAQGADYLFVEVVDLEGIADRIERTLPNAPVAARRNVVAGMERNHLTPQAVGKIATEADVKCVVLTHFVPIPEQLKRPHSLIDGVREHFVGRVLIARDLDSFA